MESIEALQLNVPKSYANEGNAELDPLSEMLTFDIHNSTPGSWEVQALVKRIIELTVELSSQV